MDKETEELVKLLRKSVVEGRERARSLEAAAASLRTQADEAEERGQGGEAAALRVKADQVRAQSREADLEAQRCREFLEGYGQAPEYHRGQAQGLDENESEEER